MSSLGDFDTGTVVYTKFTLYRPSTGAPFTLAGTPAVSVYKDNSTTQSTSGVTLTADFDSVTGLNHLAIDTSSDGTFYSAGSFFDAVITTGTVDSVSAVGTVVARFTIRKNSALKPATAGRTLVVDAAGLADANMVKAGPSGSGTAQTAGDIIGDTNDIQTRLPAALVSGRMDASVGAIDNDTTALTGFKRGVLSNVVCTCDAGSSTTSIITSACTPSGAVTDQFKGRIVIFDKNTTTAALRGQATDITASTNAATPTLTVTALTTAPASGDTFVIV